LRSIELGSTKEGKFNLGKALDVGLVITKSSRTESDKHDTSSIFGNDTDALVADIRLVSNEEPMAEVQSTVVHNVLANEQQHTEQSEPIYAHICWKRWIAIPLMTQQI
ncbi:hypothetical protein Tco_0361801, partial [Tanacetum coccineum]